MVSVAMVWGWVVASLGVLSVGASMAELPLLRPTPEGNRVSPAAQENNC